MEGRRAEVSLYDMLNALDSEQRKAVTLETNGIAAAGAGSGKTRVLASRYAWLVMEKNLKPEEILTLTFTNKAVGEMYERIYRYLLDAGAAEALKNFHKARIGTLDSFSANVARTAAARYGISPDFSSDETALRDLAGEAALRFVLDNREAPAIRALLSDHKIKKLAKEIFAETVLKYSPISSPLELDKNLETQKGVILRVWRKKVQEADKITGLIIEALQALAEMKMGIGFTKSLGDILFKSPPPSLPDIAPLLETGAAAAYTDWDADLPPSEIREQIKKYIDYYSTLIAIRVPGNYGDAYTPVVEYFRLLKGKDGDGLYQELESIANYAFNFGLCSGIFALIKKFQDEFNGKKRETGFLSFNDIARLAVDALKEHPDIRKVYKDSLRMIMIDEFQDNNALQRDLVYLLAEDPGRTGKGMAASEELEKNRMFFVGDEKQSIYRFRGADVAVFRSLGKTLFGSSGNGIIELNHNYRSRPGLIAVFNRIFGGLDGHNGIFLPPGPTAPDYEAVYSQILPPQNTNEGNDNGEGGDIRPLAHFCFLNAGELPGDDVEGIRSQDLEAAYIAEKIRSMVIHKEAIPKRKDGGIEWLPCEWSDFAVLERSYTHQATLEKYLREFGVPYNTDRPSGLFSDAPILDLRAYLRLLVYPGDRIAYAALIRSPFMRLGDLSLAVCMLALNTPGKSAEPFTEENDDLIPEADRELYRRARERYRSLREASRTLPLPELLTKLWFEEAYRYETLWTESAQVYEGLFDLFFNLACDAESRGKSLAEFIEYLEDVMNREEKPDDREIPGEGESGVRIMSIHKSKGLEFPVVFIYDCTHSGNRSGSPALVSYHEKYGLILNIPQADELPLGGNYFLKILQQEEDAKDIAELRRLLYVAMTRAECRLFLTFTLPPQTQKEKKEWDADEEVFSEETIRRRLVQLNEKSGDRQNTFLKLLAGVLPDCPSPLCGFEVIPVLSRAEIAHNAGGAKKQTGQTQREAALAAAPFYETAELIPEGKAGPPSLEASKLRYKPYGSGETVPDGKKAPVPDSPLDILLKRAGLDAAEAGVLVHAVLEARLSKRSCHVPLKFRFRAGTGSPEEEKTLRKIMDEAEAMADVFLASELGKRFTGGDGEAPTIRLESEFPVITSFVTEGKPRTVAGQIDLLAEEGSEVIVVDFKTDRIENPEDHYGQLAAYYRAVGDIFGKPVSVWLFYLRSGRAVNVTESVKGLSFDELATQIT